MASENSGNTERTSNKNGTILENVNTAPQTPVEAALPESPFDYSFVETVGRIALYDDLRSAPRVTEIPPSETGAYIEALAATIHEQAKGAGGSISYTIIREVAENFIHARFQEIVVSILDDGNTIRFADHGPGIPSKDKAQKPGFSSAVEPMKDYIRGVGSGLPIVKEYLELSRGTISIEDNLGTGAVVTISLVHGDEDEAASWDDAFPLDDPASYPLESTALPAAPAGAVPMTGAAGIPAGTPSAAPVPPSPYTAPPIAGSYPGTPAAAYNPYPTQPYTAPQAPAYGYPQAAPMTTMPRLREKEKEFLKLLAARAPLCNKDISTLTSTPPSTTSTTLSSLAKQGLIESMGSQRWLSAYGQQVVPFL